MNINYGNILTFYYILSFAPNDRSRLSEILGTNFTKSFLVFIDCKFRRKYPYSSAQPENPSIKLGAENHTNGYRKTCVAIA